METWFHKALGDGMMADMPADEIRAAFMAKIPTPPADAAIFTRLESEGRLHCEMFAYFSPAVAALAKAFDAQPCTQPQKSGLGLLAGNEQSWESLFSGTASQTPEKK